MSSWLDLVFSGSRPEGQNSAESPNGRGYENKGQKKLLYLERDPL